MKTGTPSKDLGKALAGAVLLMMLGAGGAVRAGTCESSCTDKHAQCTRSGGDYGKCMNAWHQCKTTCTTPVKATPAPAAKPMPAVMKH